MNRVSFFSLIIVLFIIIATPFSVFAQENNDPPVYIVQNGDTLGLIAIRFGTTIESIIEINGIENPNALAIGTAIKIPGLEGIHGTLITRPVNIGENLTSISLRSQISKASLIRLNRLTSPNEIYAGTTLIVPQASAEAVLSPAFTIQSNQTWLEASVLADENPWSLMDSNRLLGSWDVDAHNIVYTKNSNKSTTSDISPYVSDLNLSPLPLIQGETIELKITVPGAQNLDGMLAQQPLHFYPLGSDAYVALVGIPALQEPGLYSLEIKGQTAENGSFSLDQQILLEAGSFIQESVQGVDVATIDAVTIAQENEALSKVTETAVEPYWKGPLIYPVDDPCTASLFGNRRTYNNGSYNYYHTGMDFTVCANNLNIYAAASGKVVFSGPLPIKGNFTLIDHGWGVYTGYAHQSEFLVKTGDMVETGQQIGFIGNTGRSVGPHLHWEVWINGVPVNPLDWLQKTYP